MWHGGGWFMYMRSGDEKPKLTRELLLRVLAYARPYWWHIAGMLVTILISTGLSLVGHQHPRDMPPVRTRISQHTQQ